MKDLKKIFYKKKIIITGHTGFKGSWLTQWLKIYGANIYGISKDIPTNPSHFKVSKIYQGIRNYNMDVNNQKKITDIFVKIKPDYVFHLAAQSLVKKSYKDPTITWNTNVIGTLNVLEGLRKLKNNCTAIIITSDKCYLNKEIIRGYKETDILGGEDPYSASKASAELLINSYVKSYFNNKSNIRISSVRAGNVIGGGDWSEDRLIPDCIRCWSKKKTVVIRNPFSTRPWQNVLEAIYGYVLLAAKLSKNLSLQGESFNFGPSRNNNHSVFFLVKTMKKFWINITWSIKKNNSFKESNLLMLNTEKVKKKLKWKSVLKFEESIFMVVDWYKNFYLKKKPSQLTINQIEEYKKILAKRQLR